MKVLEVFRDEQDDPLYQIEDWQDGRFMVGCYPRLKYSFSRADNHFEIRRGERVRVAINCGTIEEARVIMGLLVSGEKSISDFIDQITDRRMLENI